MYRPKHFELYEFLDPDTFRHNQSNWSLLDEKMVESVDTLREHCGPLTINNWKWGGDRRWSGLRTQDSPYYSATSRHSSGEAADCIPKNMTPTEVRLFILDNKDLFPHIRFLEVGTPDKPLTWVHLDTDPRGSDEIKLWSPKLGYVTEEYFRECGGF